MMRYYREARRALRVARIVTPLLVLKLALPVLAAEAELGPEQWLAYRTSAGGEAGKVVGKTAGQTLELTSKRPDGVSLPELAASDPLFAKWSTPMTPAGYVWLALDRSQPEGAYDRLYIDADADGELDDDTPVVARQASAFRQQQSARFRQVKVLLPCEDGPVAFHLDFALWISGPEQVRLVATAAGWYEGSIRIGQEKAHCALFDANANGAFDDASLDVQSSDRVKISAGSAFVIGRAGKYVQLGESIRQLQVARDGAFVRIGPAADQSRFGTVEVPEGMERISAGGENGLLFPTVDQGEAKLPVGKYRLNHWEMRRTDDSGGVWEMTGALSSLAFEVTDQGPAKLEIGEPVVGSVSVRKQNTAHNFSDPTLKGSHGERITLTRSGQTPPAPAVRIKNADGSYNKVFGFEYG